MPLWHSSHLLCNPLKLVPSEKSSDLSVLAWAHVGHEEADTMAALHEPVAEHAQVEQDRVELFQLVLICVHIGCVVDLCLTNFSEKHGGLVLDEVESLDLLQTREQGLVHKRLGKHVLHNLDAHAVLLHRDC